MVDSYTHFTTGCGNDRNPSRSASTRRIDIDTQIETLPAAAPLLPQRWACPACQSRDGRVERGLPAWPESERTGWMTTCRSCGQTQPHPAEMRRKEADPVIRLIKQAQAGARKLVSGPLGVLDLAVALTLGNAPVALLIALILINVAALGLARGGRPA